MTYLARVESISRLGQKAKAEIFGKKRLSDGLWMRAEKQILDLPYAKTWKDEQLLILELDNKGRVDVVTSATEYLLEELLSWSLRLTKFDSNKADLELMRQSLHYQSIQLNRREEDLERREKFQALEEKALTTLKELAQNKLNAATVQHEALTQAWAHLDYKAEQLKRETRLCE